MAPVPGGPGPIRNICGLPREKGLLREVGAEARYSYQHCELVPASIRPSQPSPSKAGQETTLPRLPQAKGVPVSANLSSLRAHNTGKGSRNLFWEMPVGGWKGEQEVSWGMRGPALRFDRTSLGVWDHGHLVPL